MVGPQQTEHQEQKGDAMSDFQLGVLTSRVQGMIERVDRFENSVSQKLGDLRLQMNDFAAALRDLAEGYVRREEFVAHKVENKERIEEVKKDVDKAHELLRDLSAKAAAASPLAKIAWEVVKGLVIAGVAGYTGHTLSH